MIAGSPGTDIDLHQLTSWLIDQAERALRERSGDEMAAIDAGTWRRLWGAMAWTLLIWVKPALSLQRNMRHRSRKWGFSCTATSSSPQTDPSFR
jgi:hypothetical protein